MSAGKVNFENGSFKLCPFRTLTEEHKAILKGTGDYTTQMFYDCVGVFCAAYHEGICLRLYEISNKLKSQEDAELNKYRELKPEERVALIDDAIKKATRSKD